jgi:serine/threonine protein kinase
VIWLWRARPSPCGARLPLTVIDADGQGSGLDIDAELNDAGVLPAGATLGGMYRIMHEISRGAMGVVYRGEDLALGRSVAIKVLRSDLAQDGDLVKRFREEAAMLASIDHPHLVRVYSAGTHGDDVYFAMELVEGEPVSELIKERTKTEPLDAEITGKVVVEIASALEAMHALGLIHRDVKPANILLDRIRKRAVLVDVGVAKRRDSEVDAAGTPGFAAPESFLDAAEGPATDVYGLAATAYTMLTGVAPFATGPLEAVIERQLYDPPSPPSQRRAGLSPALDQCVLKALAASQADRFPSATEFARAFARGVRENMPGRATDSRRLPASVPPRRSRLQLSTRHRARRPSIQEIAARSIGNTRGAVFRIAQRVFFKQLGTAWLNDVSEDDPALAVVLHPSLPPMSWHPVELLSNALGRMAASAQNPTGLASAIGRATMTATFARFYGADPKSLSAARVLRAAGAYWPRYHSWGKLSVEQGGPDFCALSLQPSPGDPLLCALVLGGFGRIAELTGARNIHAAHPECARGQPGQCRYVLEWEDPTVSETAELPKLPTADENMDEPTRVR